MELIIATILTALTVTGLMIVGVNSETVRPVGTRERIESSIEKCIYDHADRSLDCYFINQEE